MLKLFGCSRLTGLRLTSAMALPFCRQAPPSARNPLVQHDNLHCWGRNPNLPKQLRWIPLQYRRISKSDLLTLSAIASKCKTIQLIFTLAQIFNILEIPLTQISKFTLFTKKFYPLPQGARVNFT